jgi:anti-sigma regulatory factor (Ser/Thr protein kinase)
VRQELKKLMARSRNNPDRKRGPCENMAKTIYEIPSNRKAIKEFSEKATKAVENARVDIDLHQLELILLEALTNALLYGNFQISSKTRDDQGEDFFWQLVEEREKDADFSARKIVLETDCVEDELRFTVSDEGQGFDWRSYLESIDTGKTERYHDRGILLIQNYADELTWNDKGNEINFVIKI